LKFVRNFSFVVFVLFLYYFLLRENKDEFITEFSSAIGFAPGFTLINMFSDILDIFTPGASKASGAATQHSGQISKILDVLTTSYQTNKCITLTFRCYPIIYY
jgi:hypothetical protein